MTERAVGVLPQEVRRQLVVTAAAEFARAGYERASLNRVLRACGMSKSSFYHYLGSKQALFDLVVGDGSAELVSRLEVPPADRFATGDYWAQVERLLARLAGLADAPAWLTDVGRLFYLEDAPRSPGSALDRAGAAIDGWLARVVAVGRERGALREDLPESLQVDVTIAVLRAMDEWSVRHPEVAVRKDVVGAQLDVVRRVLAPS
jgi:AcrR family transcriptional regulator